MKKFVRSLTIVVSAIVTVVALAGPAQAEEPAARVVNFNSGMCMAIPGGSLVAGERVIQWPCGVSEDHVWRLRTQDGLRYQLVNNRSGLCLAVPGGSLVRGTGLIQWYCGDYAANYWFLEDNNGLHRIYNASAFQCAAVPGGSLVRGTGLIQWPCGSSRDHYWYFALV
jgi:hypothetical protein